MKYWDLIASDQPASQETNFDIYATIWRKTSFKALHTKMFYLIFWICLQSFVQECSIKRLV